MFEALYREMAGDSPAMSLAPDGPELWIKEIQPLLGRFSELIVCHIRGKAVGFVQGVTRFTPSYFGGLKVGYLAHLYVCPEYRKLGLGANLVEKIEAWFASQNVASFEAQVMVANKSGRAFWSDRGYAEELVQIRKSPTSVE